jgi:hypothetical protein
MRTAEINKQTIWYANQTSLVANTDVSDNETGEFSPGYSDPVEIALNISPARGKAILDQFGVNVNYDKKMVADSDLELPFEVGKTVFWVDVVPVIESGGSTNTPHDMVLAAYPGISINGAMYAVKYVKVG